MLSGEEKEMEVLLGELGLEISICDFLLSLPGMPEEIVRELPLRLERILARKDSYLGKTMPEYDILGVEK